MPHNETFHEHLGHCARCRDHPFALCTVGQNLLLLVGTDRDPALATAPAEAPCSACWCSVCGAEVSRVHTCSSSDRRMDPERLLRFVTGWRERLVRTPAERLSDEQFGQLVTLNTIISFLTEP